MKKTALALFLICSIVNAQETTITYTTLNPAEQKKAEHWGMDEKQWIKYNEYMDVEGKFFYEKVDPLTVMSLITTGEERQNYIVKQLMFERTKIQKETALANDAWRIQQALYGDEPLMDFRSLPWINAEEEDWRLYKHPNTLESIKLRQEATLEEQRNSSDIKVQDELLVFLSEDCAQCQARVEVLKKEQPLNIVLVPLLKDNKTISNWIDQMGLSLMIDNNKVKIHVYEPQYFEAGFVPKPDAIYQARQGKIIKEL